MDMCLMATHRKVSKSSGAKGSELWSELIKPQTTKARVQRRRRQEAAVQSKPFGGWSKRQLLFRLVEATTLEEADLDARLVFGGKIEDVFGHGAAKRAQL